MATQNYNVFLKKRETAQNLNERLEIIIKEYMDYKRAQERSLKILDIGSGRNPQVLEFISEGDLYYACDYYKDINRKVYSYKQIDLNAENLSKVYRNHKFDVVICGEVIEHLFSPDHLLSEIKKIMNKESVLILSTPNLSYYVNRFLLLLGISPLYLENSSEYKLGRKYKILGQGNPTEGHIKVFTHGALMDLFKLQGYSIEKIVSCSTWNLLLDKVVIKISRSLSPTNVFVLKKQYR